MTQNWPKMVCPEDGTSLTSSGSVIQCEHKHQFKVELGIPRFVPPSNYASHFGAQWNRYRRTQLDSFSGKPITKTRMQRCFGPELWARTKDGVILECGCGAGRFTEVLLDVGARVVSIDLSSAVEANAQNFPLSPSHQIVQADIRKLPFEKQSFDVVVCLGVIQHTPSPEETIAALYSRVKPGGSLVIDHYTYDIGWYTKTAPLFRAVMKRMAPEKSLRFTEAMVQRMLPLHKKVSKSRLRSIVYRLSPVLTYYTTYPELDDDQQMQWAMLDTHDSLTDWFKHFRTKNQIIGILERLGATNIWCEYGGIGVEARATRPQA